MILAPLECWPPPRFDCILPLLTKVAFPRGTPSTSFQFLRYLWSSITREFRSPESDLCSIELMPVHTFTRPRYIDPSICTRYAYCNCLATCVEIIISPWRAQNTHGASILTSTIFSLFYSLIKIKSRKFNGIQRRNFSKKKEMILMALPLSEKFSSDT